MIQIENTEVIGWEAAIRGMRNPLNSWGKIDSYPQDWCEIGPEICCGYHVGENDLALMHMLAAAGSDHRKFMRMLVVYADITAPLYWWKEFDTYKVGTVANSCSTMHTIHTKPITLEDFSTDGTGNISAIVLEETIGYLEDLRKEYLETKEKQWWRALIQLLPESYNQRRTVQLNYEVLANIYGSRKNHKLDEWRELCKWIEILPHHELITGKEEAHED